MRLEGKNVLVVGLGESGKAAARFAAARGAAVTVTDRRSAAELGEAVEEMGRLGARLALGEHPRALFVAQDLIVPSPGVPWNLPELEAARREGVAVMGELEIAASFLNGPVIGITGTNGKTTTTSLIGHIFETAGVKAATGGNLGTPVLAMADESSHDRWNVLELSSFQLEATSTFPVHIGVVLNVTPDHLDRHGAFEAYAAAKGRMFQAQTAADFAVLHADDAVCHGYAAQAAGSVYWFSRTSRTEPGAWVEDGWIVCDGRRVAEAKLPIPGPHNLENSLAAVVAATLAGVDAAPIADALRSFRTSEHRLELVAEIDGVAYYNDSKATNVDAAKKAIETFDHGLWVILGGSDKGLEYAALREPLAGRARAALLIGESAHKIEHDLAGVVPAVHAGDLRAALSYARGRAEPGDTVLLSPACASFDQFRNYGDRGRQFKEMVQALRPEVKV
ncbi:MAG TPA: UDP-N-acetylmuramoyl-L-alanine--D-glutamate ligase [Bryobacterales bacterium]|nr:UDP-N-acetylmuramoyl-L-alanine--D-glutamate ligase [Bryobacterales bacterium]